MWYTLYISSVNTRNTNTPTKLPNTTLQQTSSPDITTVSNTLYNRTSWTTQHSLSSDHLPIITTINIQHDYRLQQNQWTHQLQESWLDTIHGRHRVGFRSDHHTHQHTHCQQTFYKHHTDGRQAQHTKGHDAQQFQAPTRPHSMQNHPNKHHKEIIHLWSSSQTLKWGDNFRHTKTQTKHMEAIQQQNSNHTQTHCELFHQTIHKHATHKTIRSINRSIHKIQGYNITLTTTQVQEAIKQI